MRVAEFFKISKNDNNKDFYDDIKLPLRATLGSAGYDFFIPYKLTIKAHESVDVETNIRCKIKNGFALIIIPRSSLGRKYKLTLNNTVGLIDSDYYYATNEGHIILSLTNNSENDLVLEKNDRIVQGIFIRYHITRDDNVKSLRHGGFGSTGR